MKNTLGKLERVELRIQWRDEAKDFTPWLAKEVNLQLLGEAIDLEIELEDMEVPIGNFKADIVARDVETNRQIIIENQLSKTNHDHLGKIITYASGLEANIVIWITSSITEEHRQAVDWLNEISSEEYSFFAIEMELWRINDSIPAPKFNVVCSPNEWAKRAKEVSKSAALTETKSLQLDFWNSLRDYFTENGTFLRLRKPRPQHWYTMAIGRSKFHISLSVNTMSNRLGCELYMRGEQAKKAFTLLQEKQQEIESEFGEDLDWQELPEGQDCRIILNRNGDIKDREKWDEYFSWFHEKAEALYKVFSERVQRLDLS